jgi:FtsH-binding integral membrane protein
MLSNRFGWLLVIGGFALLGWMARSFTENENQQTQYAGLAIYVVAEAIIFMPLLWLASKV